MNSEVIKKLKTLKLIAPAREAMERTRIAIFAAPRRRDFAVFFRSQPAWVRGFAYALGAILLVASPFLRMQGTPQLSSLQNAGDLAKEANTLPISIELQQVSYHQTNDAAIQTAMAEVGSSNANHLNSGILETEMNQVQHSSDQNKQIDQLLNSVTL